MDDGYFGRMREDGFVSLPALAVGDELGRLMRATSRLRAIARSLETSTGDFVLEAAGIGGWAAWQQGRPAIAGVLRSAARIHRHVPEFDLVQRSLGLADGPVAAVAGVPGTLVNAFLWAKPPRVGSAKPWHQDMAFAPPGFCAEQDSIVTVWIALDPATPRNGCLEFIPGSHRHGLLPHAGDGERGPGEPPLAHAIEPHVAPEHMPLGVEPAAVPLGRGSAVMFDGMVLHRSTPNTTAAEPRTAVSFVYQVPRPWWTRPAPGVIRR